MVRGLILAEREEWEAGNWVSRYLGGEESEVGCEREWEEGRRLAAAGDAGGW